MSDKKRAIAFVVILFIAALFSAFIMIYDYVIYTSNQTMYKVCDVTITRMGDVGDTGQRWAYFSFEDSNIVIEGKVLSNWWEQKGDVIKIAYDSTYHFIRTEIIYVDSALCQFVFCIIMLIVMFFRLVNRKTDKC